MICLRRGHIMAAYRFPVLKRHVDRAVACCRIGRGRVHALTYS